MWVHAWLQDSRLISEAQGSHDEVVVEIAARAQGGIPRIVCSCWVQNDAVEKIFEKHLVALVPVSYIMDDDKLGVDDLHGLGCVSRLPLLPSWCGVTMHAWVVSSYYYGMRKVLRITTLAFRNCA